MSDPLRNRKGPSACSRRESTGSTTDSIARPAAATTTTAAARARLVLSFVDLERPAIEVLAVERLHGARGVRARHLDKSEAAGLARVAIRDQRKLLDGAVRREQIANRFFGGRERKIADV